MVVLLDPSNPSSRGQPAHKTHATVLVSEPKGPLLQLKFIDAHVLDLCCQPYSVNASPDHQLVIS